MLVFIFILAVICVQRIGIKGRHAESRTFTDTLGLEEGIVEETALVVRCWIADLGLNHNNLAIDHDLEANDQLP